MTPLSPPSRARSTATTLRSFPRVLGPLPRVLGPLPRVLGRPAPSASIAPPAFTALLGDRSRLRSALLDKRAAILQLETAWVAAAEADAAVSLSRTVRMDDRETWDRATWDRYLTAASRHEPDYMPRIRRLLGEAQAIEKLLALPVGPTPSLACSVDHAA